MLESINSPTLLNGMHFLSSDSVNVSCVNYYVEEQNIQVSRRAGYTKSRTCWNLDCQHTNGFLVSGAVWMVIV